MEIDQNKIELRTQVEYISYNLNRSFQAWQWLYEKLEVLGNATAEVYFADLVRMLVKSEDLALQICQILNLDPSKKHSLSEDIPNIQNFINNKSKNIDSEFILNAESTEDKMSILKDLQFFVDSYYSLQTDTKIIVTKNKWALIQNALDAYYHQETLMSHLVDALEKHLMLSELPRIFLGIQNVIHFSELSLIAGAQADKELAWKYIAHAAFDSGQIQSMYEAQIKPSLLKVNAINAAKKRWEKDPKQNEKSFIKDCWSDWSNEPNKYKSKAEFARDMLDKCERLSSQKKIEDWCREWEKAHHAS